MTVETQDFDDFVVGRSGALLRTAYLLTGDFQYAEDLLQSALTTMYLRWGRMRDKGAAESYVRRILVTTYTSWWRRKSWAERPMADVPERRTARAPDEIDDRDEMWAHLQALPRQQRAVLVLRFYEERSVQETAGLLGIGAGTVKSHTSRALEALRIRITDTDAHVRTAAATAGEHRS